MKINFKKLWRAHGEVMESFFESSWYSSYCQVGIDGQKETEVSQRHGRHRGDGRTTMCWKDKEVQIRKDGELSESSWAAFWRAHSIQ